MARVLMLIVMLVSGTATSQLPEFSQQYSQRLGGAIDALEEVLADFKRDASQFGLSVREAIARQKASEDPFVQARGNSMAVVDARLTRLKEQRADLQRAGPVERLVIFARGFDPKLARATAQDFAPAVPVTIAGLLSAGAGALVGYLILNLLFGIVRLGRRRSKVSD
ncbi:MAG: DUF2937 family protein [Roseibium sp.]|uniref:DUF2937 family protein n=1 Tax=Roseibium sp. TaxID=1936156 RepID=UPI00260D98A1|nr:DUF2937 family protein [Roseibium sp.]MCV0429584.1 DUF2937 family protein [Roseibium sp.]